MIIKKLFIPTKNILESSEIDMISFNLTIINLPRCHHRIHNILKFHLFICLSDGNIFDLFFQFKIKFLNFTFY